MLWEGGGERWPMFPSAVTANTAPAFLIASDGSVGRVSVKPQALLRNLAVLFSQGKKKKTPPFCILCCWLTIAANDEI